MPNEIRKVVTYAINDLGADWSWNRDRRALGLLHVISTNLDFRHLNGDLPHRNTQCT